ncbi:MAG: hypothetical protein ACE5HC_06055 [Candidatus Binatia bacterium]
MPRLFYRFGGIPYMNGTTKAILALIPLTFVDAIIPIPIVGAILLYVILVRPVWFSNLVREIYEKG